MLCSSMLHRQLCASNQIESHFRYYVRASSKGVCIPTPHCHKVHPCEFVISVLSQCECWFKMCERDWMNGGFSKTFGSGPTIFFIQPGFIDLISHLGTSPGSWQASYLTFGYRSWMNAVKILRRIPWIEMYSSNYHRFVANIQRSESLLSRLRSSVSVETHITCLVVVGPHRELLSTKKVNIETCIEYSIDLVCSFGFWSC